MLENYLSNITKNCLSKMHIKLETYIKARTEGTARNIAIYFCKFMLFFKHSAVFRVLQHLKSLNSLQE